MCGINICRKNIRKEKNLLKTTIIDDDEEARSVVDKIKIGN